MKIGQVMKKEREGKTGLNRYKSYTVEAMAKELSLTASDYEKIEAGESPVEKWFPLLCNLAVHLETPTSRLLAKSGKAKDCKPGQAGTLIRLQREERGFTIEEMAEKLGLPVKEYVPVEKGDSPLEKIGPMMLRFAELIEQPVFNIFHPCGVPYDKLDDYP
jgi:transcriptional regulator with XRE-family HTH domain